MKKALLLVIFATFSVFTIQAQETEPSSKSLKNVKCEFEVYGNCLNCEKRIEKAALIKGVKMADWNRETNVMTVIYNGKKTSVEQIHQSIAEKGHDTKTAKADDEVYDALPGCCQYRPTPDSK